MIPFWLHLLAIVSLLLAAGCAIVIAVDVARHPQHMWIMNIVWPVTGLYGSVLGLWAYYRYGRLAMDEKAQAAMARDETMPSARLTPFPAKVMKGTFHCGSGCMLGDICAELLVLAFPAILTLAGWHWLFAERTFAVWVVDYVFAFGLGIAFQYFTIAPMQGLGVKDGLIAAVKADALSLTAWQVGMYGIMAIAIFWVFHRLLGTELLTLSFEFWFAMQIAMVGGFATAYPVNWWLIRKGIKEAM